MLGGVSGAKNTEALAASALRDEKESGGSWKEMRKPT